MGDLLQMGVLLGSAVAALQAVTRLIIVVWSFRTDQEGRHHALRLLASLLLPALLRTRYAPGWKRLAAEADLAAELIDQRHDRCA